MKVFLSWSGTKAKIVATAMRSFLQDVNQRTDVWFSASDISPGDRWGLQLAAELESTDYGIICLTQESLHRPWPIFEAGALAKSVADGRVCPYLIDVSMSQLSGPLAQFQAKLATKDETWELLQAVNLAMASDALPESRLKKYFDTFWPNLAEVLSRVEHEFRALPRDIRARLLEILPPLGDPLLSSRPRWPPGGDQPGKDHLTAAEADVMSARLGDTPIARCALNFSGYARHAERHGLLRAV